MSGTTTGCLARPVEEEIGARVKRKDEIEARVDARSVVTLAVDNISPLLRRMLGRGQETKQ